MTIMTEIRNARIEDTFLGREDHGIMTFLLYLEISGGSCCAVGNYALDAYDPETKTRFFSAKSMGAISKILEVVGVDTWEKLPGKYIRVKTEGWGGIVHEIGNLMDDKWLDFREFFKEE